MEAASKSFEAQELLFFLMRWWHNYLMNWLKELLNPTSYNIDSQLKLDYERLTDRVVVRKPSYYDGKAYPAELENWIKNMKKVFDVVEVLAKQQISTDIYYLGGKAYA